MPFITVNNLKIHYIDNNKKDIPLLFIHGWLGNLKEWIYQYCFFNSKRHIIIVDLPGFGESDKPKIKYSTDFFTKQITDFLRKLGYNEVILVGHSLGGMIALNITIQNLNLVKKLILISTSSTFSQTIKLKFLLFWLNLLFRFFYKSLLRNIINQIIPNEKKKREYNKLHKYALKLPKSVVRTTFKYMTLNHHLNIYLHKIYQPTLIIHGNKDKIITKSMIENLSNLLQNSRTYFIKNSSHRVMIENYTQVNKIIDIFVNT